MDKATCRLMNPARLKRLNDAKLPGDHMQSLSHSCHQFVDFVDFVHQNRVGFRTVTQMEDCMSVISVSFLATGDSGDSNNVPDAWRLDRLGDEGDAGLAGDTPGNLGPFRKTSISPDLEKCGLIVVRFPSMGSLSANNPSNY